MNPFAIVTLIKAISGDFIRDGCWDFVLFWLKLGCVIVIVFCFWECVYRCDFVLWLFCFDVYGMQSTFAAA